MNDEKLKELILALIGNKNLVDLLIKNGSLDILTTLCSFSETKTDQALDDDKDNISSTEEKKRNKEITKLLEGYVNTYIKKSDENSKLKTIVFNVFLGILIVLTLAIIAVIILVPIFGYDLATILTSIVASCVTYLISVLSILRIITKYVFNEHEDSNITQVVDVILKNDLQNKEVRAKFDEKNGSFDDKKDQ